MAGAGTMNTFIIAPLAWGLCVAAGVTPFIVPVALWSGSFAGSFLPWTSNGAMIIGFFEQYVPGLDATAMQVRTAIYLAIIAVVFLVVMYILTRAWKMISYKKYGIEQEEIEDAAHMAKPDPFSKNQLATLIIIFVFIALLLVPAVINQFAPNAACKWMSSNLSIPVTSVLGISLVAIFGGKSIKEVFSSDVNWNMILLITGMGRCVGAGGCGGVGGAGRSAGCGVACAFGVALCAHEERERPVAHRQLGERGLCLRRRANVDDVACLRVEAARERDGDAGGDLRLAYVLGDDPARDRRAVKRDVGHLGGTSQACAALACAANRISQRGPQTPPRRACASALAANVRGDFVPLFAKSGTKSPRIRTTFVLRYNVAAIWLFGLITEAHVTQTSASAMPKSVQPTVRAYTGADLPAMTRIWNEVVRDGMAFPQEDEFTAEQAREFFAAQSHVGVAVLPSAGQVAGLYILHPNNVGRCGHICNASFAVASDVRGAGIGHALVRDCIAVAGKLGFGILQLNAVVASNASARKLYERVGFHALGTVKNGFRAKDGTFEDICLYYIEV